MNFESPVVSPFSVFDMMMDPLAIAAGFGTGAGGMNAQQSLQQGNLLAPSTRIRSPIVKLDVGETPNLYIIKVKKKKWIIFGHLKRIASFPPTLFHTPPPLKG